MPRIRPHLVVAVVYDRLCTFEFGCTTEFFALERPELDVPWYGFDVCSIEPGEIRAAGGIRIRVDKGLRRLDQADTIVLPGWRDADEPPPDALLRKIRSAYARGARLCSICSGVFILAAAGVLDGRRATTHWRYVERLASRYPEITVEPQSLYVDEGQVLTSAGSAAGLDMFLHLVRRDFGASVANTVAQRLVIPAHRDGGQAQYLPRPVPQDERGRLGRLMQHVRANLAATHSLPALARLVSMSPRTLQRQFRASVGMSPREWVTRERISAAKDLLESSAAPLGKIATQTGFSSTESFRKQFRLIAGVSPSAYRAQFGPGDHCPVTRNQKFRALFRAGRPFVCMGAFDAITARLAEACGAEAVFVSGFVACGVEAGEPDVGALSQRDMFEHIRRVCRATTLPVFADADTGYGGMLDVQRTIRLWEEAGASCLHLEDQSLPKKCGHFAGKQLVTQHEMVRKLEAMIEARQDPDFFIVARTDAIAVSGLDDAVARLTAYAATGADGLYADALESVDQMRELSRRLAPLGKPLLFNMVTSGKSPALSLQEIGALGFDFALCPVEPMLAMHKAVKDMMTSFYAAGCDTRAIADRLTSFAEYNEFVGLEEALEREARFTRL